MRYVIDIEGEETTSIEDMIIGLILLRHYAPDAYIGADHDIFYVYKGGTIQPSAEDMEVLDKAGWFQDDDGDWRKFV